MPVFSIGIARKNTGCSHKFDFQIKNELKIYLYYSITRVHMPKILFIVLKCGRYIQWNIYYSAIKRNEILTHATTWKYLEDIMLSEISKK